MGSLQRPAKAGYRFGQGVIERPGAGPSGAPGLDEQPLVQAAPLRERAPNLTQHFPKEKQHPGDESGAGLILLVP